MCVTQRTTYAFPQNNGKLSGSSIATPTGYYPKKKTRTGTSTKRKNPFYRMLSISMRFFFRCYFQKVFSILFHFCLLAWVDVYSRVSYCCFALNLLPMLYMVYLNKERGSTLPTLFFYSISIFYWNYIIISWQIIISLKNMF